jgi:hypothetical protein
MKILVRQEVIYDLLRLEHMFAQQCKSISGGYCIKGVCLAWLDLFVDNTKTKECGSTFKGLVDASDTSTERLIAMWGEPASVPTVQMLK